MGFFSKLFGKNKSDKKSENEPSLIERIVLSMNLLFEKSGNLNSQFEDEKSEIQKLAQNSKNLVEVDEIFGAKLEHEILASITKVSFSCDNALAGKNLEQVKKNLTSLNSLMNQRLALQAKN